RMTARDMARFGLLYLRGGQWQGRSIVPREWVEESTRSYSDIGQAGGYGYLWWVAPNGGPHFTSAYFTGRVYSARGAGGHYIVVVPYLDLVVVHRVNTDIQGREVSNSQFGHLIQLIIDAKKQRRAAREPLTRAERPRADQPACGVRADISRCSRWYCCAASLTSRIAAAATMQRSRVTTSLRMVPSLLFLPAVRWQEGCRAEIFQRISGFSRLRARRGRRARPGPRASPPLPVTVRRDARQ